MDETKRAGGDANADPLTGEPGAHPLGVGVGSASGAAAGAVIGAVAGPVGLVAGAALGGLAGGLTGKGAAEALNPSVEDAYWRENYATRAYVPAGTEYDFFRPAYRYGWDARGRYGELNWEALEPRLEREWPDNREGSKLSWQEAKLAARDAWDRIRPGTSYAAENR